MVVLCLLQGINIFVIAFLIFKKRGVKFYFHKNSDYPTVLCPTISIWFIKGFQMELFQLISSMKKLQAACSPWTVALVCIKSNFKLFSEFLIMKHGGRYYYESNYFVSMTQCERHPKHDSANCFSYYYIRFWNINMHRAIPLKFFGWGVR